MSEPLKHAEPVMGTVFSFDIRDRVTPAISAALTTATRELHSIDAVFSTYKSDSAISRLDRGEITLADCPPEVGEVLELCREVERASDGWFSHTAAGHLDPSGLVKGWAVARASQILHNAGARNTCVNGGGDIQLRGEAVPGIDWRVGISDPRSPDRLLTAVSGRDLAVATSGIAERGRHVLDPHTGNPAEGLAAVTVIGPHITEADSYATAACAMGLARARTWVARLPGYEALMVTERGTVWRSAGFPSAT